MFKTKLNLKLVRYYLMRRMEKTMPIQIIKQPDINLCWAACYRMIDQWAGGPMNGWCRHVRCGSLTSSCITPKTQCNAPRFTKDVLSDWISLGYYQTAHTTSPLTIAAVRKSIVNRKPIMAFLRYQNSPIGHYCLIVGTGRTRSNADTSLIIADPLQERLLEREASDFIIAGRWAQSWEVAE